MKKDSRKSMVWNYYEKLEGEARCMLCNNTIASFKNTSNLVKHLRRKHKDINLNLNVSQRLQQFDKAQEESNSADSYDFQTEGMTITEEEQIETAVTETNTAVHTIQAYRDANGTTFLYLQPPTEGEAGVHIQNQQFHPVTSESITANGEIVSVAVQKDPSALESQEETTQKAHEEATPIRIVHAPLKNHQGSSATNRTVVRQLNRPSPIKTAHAAGSYNSFNNNKNKEDSYEAFGRYIASMLRNLPSKNACKVQGEIVNWILRETMKSSEC